MSSREAVVTESVKRIVLLYRLMDFSPATGELEKKTRTQLRCASPIAMLPFTRSAELFNAFESE